MKMLREPIRILHVATKMDRGGLETLIMNYYRHIDRMRVQFDFLLHRDEPGDFDAEIEKLGGKIYHVPRANPLNPSYFKSLDSFFINNPQYKIVHSHIDCLSAFPLKAAKENGVPIRIAHAHSSNQDKDYKYPLKLICKRLIAQEATHLFACGHDAGCWMFGKRSFSIIPNAIKTEDFCFSGADRLRIREVLDIPDKSFVLGHVGRFLPVKNQSFLLNVFREVKSQRKDSFLILVGDGPTRQVVESEARSLGVADNVKFIGISDEIPKLMSAMDVFVMPSLYEGLPMVLVEAQTSGLPCVISENIPEDCNLTNLVNRESLANGATCWANSVIAVAMEKGRDCRDGYAARVMDAGYSIDNAAGRLQRFYETVVAS